MADNPYAKYANPYAGYVPIGVPDPAKPLDLKSKQIGVQKGEAELALTPYQLRKQAADAAAAELDLKNKQEAYLAQHPKGPTATVLGPDSLKALSPPDQEIVKALAEGRLAFPAGFALKAPWWQQKLEQVAAYDPSFDATNFNQRAKARAILLNGKVGTSANALNTSIGHVGMLNEQIGGTASHNLTPLNSLINTFEQLTGDPGITNFKDTAGKLASELTSVYRNGGGAEQDVIRQLQSLDPNASEAQKKAVIQNTLDLLASKQAANLYQYSLGGGKPEVDLLDPAARKVLDQFPDIRDKYFAGPPAPMSQAAAALLTHNGGQPPSAPPPPPGDGNTPPPVGPQGGVPQADYSSMVGQTGGSSVATMDPNSKLGAFRQTYRNEFDPVMANTVSAFIRHGTPYDTVAAYAQSHGATPPDPSAYAAAVAFAKQHSGAVNVEANKAVPTTIGERLDSSPAAALLSGAVRGGTAGLSDVAGRTLMGPQYDANLQALSLTHPGADLTGNVIGGFGAALGGGAAADALRLAPRARMLLGAERAQLGKLAPAASDAAYGGIYGASENPDNPLGGAAAGVATAVPAGIGTRALVRGTGRAIAPTGGNAQPLYDAGVIPTLGQRAAASNGMFGRGINLAEQAMQSVPLLGALPAMARQSARNQFQKGAFNQALADINQTLPKGVGAGPEAHSFTAGQFTKAYDQAREGMQFAPDNQFAVDLADFSAKLNDGTLNAEQKSQVQKRIETAVDSRLTRNTDMNGTAYKNAASELAQTQADWAKTDPLKANALGDYLSIFDAAAKRNSDPQAVQMLNQADAGYAKFVRIQDAAKRGGAAKDAGTFSPTDYAASVKNMGTGLRTNAYSRGDALGQDYANAGLSLRDGLSDSGTAMRLGVLGGIQGAEGTALAAGGHLGILANPATLGMFAPYVGNIGGRMIAPRSATLPPILANPINRAGNAIYNRADTIGRFGVPAALDYFLSQ